MDLISSEMRNILSIKFSKWPASKLEAALEEYQRFFLLAGKIDQSMPIPVSSEIDQIWHECILNTRDYFDTCTRIFNNYLHHKPFVGEKKISSNSLESNLFWICLYNLNFGHFSKTGIEYWPIISDLLEKSGWSLDHFNRIIDFINERVISHEESKGSFK